MPTEARLSTLETRHAALERRITDEGQRPAPDTGELHRLKLEKLRLKEEMERLRHRPH
ncbi:YdcH family protein [Plastoroseomonas hellenica]|uniref:DUF465 domain-containing protein n=1 Tax=Plastoroseomonas hellenica TaxID=2687306 RepID=A0ABS5EV70_9PROT|nr:DUF465 domain-containing protein [Plastoroseomonas hellenica]MBR0642155.1 DUF465 domain-containing protein [Plastoroseomonas hellenica]MBR0664196.1 DUF465 domain-containing protein [Plastoroseomonas hellenica]